MDEVNTFARASDEFATITYPSPAFRPIPSFTLDVPHEWVVTEYPDSLFAMGTQLTEEGAWSNVIVRHERAIRDVTLEEIARASWLEFEAENPGAVISDERLVRFESVHYVREVALPQIGELVPITRIDSWVFGPVVDQPTVDLFHFTWLNPTASTADFKPLYVKILSSLHFEAG